MSKLTLLPCTFAVPDLSDGREEFERYLKTLLDWKSALKEKWIRTSLSDNTINLLMENNAYPVYPHIAKACETFGIIEYSVNDCVQVIETVLHRSISFEDECGINDVSWITLNIKPDITLLQKEFFHNEVKRILLILGIVCQHCKRDNIPHILACAKLPEFNKSLVVVNALVDIMEPDYIGTLSPPFEISQEVPACTDFSSFLMSLDANALLCSAKDSIAVHLSIQIAVHQELEAIGRNPVWEEPTKFRVGREFVESAENYGLRNDQTKVRMLLSTLVDLLLKRNLQHVHALRIDEGGNSPQKLRGKDKAMRFDIDREWHLNFWNTESEIPEFAAIVPHNCFDIPE